MRLQPFPVPLEVLWERAPAALQTRAREPLGPLKRSLLEALRAPGALDDTPVWDRVPIWIEAFAVGYLLDFLLPEHGVAIQIDCWEPRYLDEDESWLDDLDFDAEPDHPFHDARIGDLSRECGIETLQYWDTAVTEVGIDEFVRELRCELGLDLPSTSGKEDTPR